MKSLTPAQASSRRLVYGLVAAFVLALTGCQTKTTTVQQQGGFFPQKNAPATEFYAHCETCKWCKGPFNRLQDAKQTASAHNIKLHDSWKVAYFDTQKCSR